MFNAHANLLFDNNDYSLFWRPHKPRSPASEGTFRVEILHLKNILRQELKPDAQNCLLKKVA